MIYLKCKTSPNIQMQLFGFCVSNLQALVHLIRPPRFGHKNLLGKEPIGIFAFIIPLGWSKGLLMLTQATISSFQNINIWNITAQCLESVQQSSASERFLYTSPAHDGARARPDIAKEHPIRRDTKLWSALRLSYQNLTPRKINMTREKLACFFPLPC